VGVAVAAANAAAKSGTAMPDPIHQFEISKLWELSFAGWDVSFTNASLYMMLAVASIVGFLFMAMRHPSLVPSRLQSIAETGYEFVANIVRDSAGEEAMPYFPFVFSLFIFIFACNMLGMLPGSFTVTSQIIVTAALAALVFFSVIVIGFMKNGLGFLRLFVPGGVPWFVLPVVVPIEVISFFSRPLSHSIRLFANMFAGHVALKIFGGFIVMLLGAGAWGALAPLPFVAAIGLSALELLVAFLQAYVFTLLTCMYLSDALHPSH
jgi:F-type H+-transporting ATPase subunit a